MSTNFTSIFEAQKANQYNVANASFKQRKAKLKALQKSISSNSEAIDIANELIDETLLNIKDGKLEFRVLEENLLL